MQYLTPDWPTAPALKSFVTLAGDMSESKYGTGNLGLHTNDEPFKVNKNRQLLMGAMNWQRPPVWLKQEHGTKVVKIGSSEFESNEFSDEVVGDAVYTQLPRVPCVVLTADCLPILVASSSTLEVAAIHGGWRGLAGGIIESTLACFAAPMSSLKLWLGPAIGPKCFEVGEEVRECFLDRYPELSLAFHLKKQTITQLRNQPLSPKKWWMDIFQTARLIAQQCGVLEIYGGGLCTFSDSRFFSYRKDKNTGRFATGIWVDA